MLLHSVVQPQMLSILFIHNEHILHKERFKLTAHHFLPKCHSQTTPTDSPVLEDVDLHPHRPHIPCVCETHSTTPSPLQYCQFPVFAQQLAGRSFRLPTRLYPAPHTIGIRAKHMLHWRTRPVRHHLELYSHLICMHIQSAASERTITGAWVEREIMDKDETRIFNVVCARVGCSLGGCAVGWGEEDCKGDECD